MECAHHILFAGEKSLNLYIDSSVFRRIREECNKKYTWIFPLDSYTTGLIYARQLYILRMMDAKKWQERATKWSTAAVSCLKRWQQILPHSPKYINNIRLYIWSKFILRCSTKTYNDYFDNSLFIYNNICIVNNKRKSYQFHS